MPARLILSVAALLIVWGAASAAGAKPAACDRPRLEFKETKLDARDQARFAEHFAAAFARACGDGLFAAKPLVDQRSEDKQTIVVLHSPVAKGTAIYFAPSGAPPAMLLEAPAGAPLNVPTADALYKAMHCAVRWPTADEQEQDGRCPPD